MFRHRKLNGKEESEKCTGEGKEICLCVYVCTHMHKHRHTHTHPHSIARIIHICIFYFGVC